MQVDHRHSRRDGCWNSPKNTWNKAIDRREFVLTGVVAFHVLVGMADEQVQTQHVEKERNSEEDKSSCCNVL